MKYGRAASLVTNIICSSQLDRISKRVCLGLMPGYVRVVNYHDIPYEELGNFLKQVDWLISEHDLVSPSQLESILTSELQLRRPGIVFTFDDGFLSHATFIAEELYKRGIVGWFFIPTAAPDVSIDAQQKWAIDHKVVGSNTTTSTNTQLFGAWDDWVNVSKNHVIGSHTHDHVRFSDSLSKGDIEYQLNTSYSLLREKLDIHRKIFCWVGGEKESYSRVGFEAINDVGTSLSFTTCSLPVIFGADPLQIERTNIESGFSSNRVRICDSGLVDMRYMFKRRYINKLKRIDNTCKY